ncbi:GroES-like protein [Auriculariales sp. MPI-PUGE-AT-0066]|nr:GroES-like protein [Auriculariales sp. MPI-PUGE-AT-0066]
MSTPNFANEAAWIKEAKGRIVVGPADTPVPGPGEILVKVRVVVSVKTPTNLLTCMQTEAIAFHPLDTKLQLFNFFDLPYPAIFGASIGGTVVSVGPGVEHLKVDDAIVATTPTYFRRDYRFGTFQKYALVVARNAVKVTGNGYSVLEAVTVPTQGTVAAFALGVASALPRRPNTAAQKTTETVLIWGAGSSVGTYAVQYAAQAGYTVVATASTSTPGETDRVKALGATHVIDYRQSPEEVVAALAPYAPYAVVLDSVTVPASLAAVSKLLVQTQPDETKRLVRALGMDAQKVVDPSVKVESIPYVKLSFDHATHGDFVDYLSKDWFANGIENKSIIPQKPQIVEGGLDKVQECLDLVLKVKIAQVVLKLTN